MGNEGRFHAVGSAREEMLAFMASLGEAGFRADQVLRWVYGGGAAGFDGMTNLPLALRARLEEAAALYTTAVRQVRTSADGTEKLLLGLADGETVETVVIPAGERRTVCISTQVGCPMGCAFCATGLGGLVRDLTAGEIIEQVLHARRRFGGERASMNVVVMGIGEPLSNFAALSRALEVFTASWGLALSGRRITVSTVGLPGRIRDLAGLGLGVNLAVSLHAADDSTRGRLVPGAAPVGEIVEAARAYLLATDREVTFEYVMLRDVNDSAAAAHALAERLGDLPVLVNLIPLNPVAGLGWQAPTPDRVERFVGVLRSRGVRAEVRRRRGADIEAACGQLRRAAAGQGSGLEVPGSEDGHRSP